ncbi:MAG: hypothetical protein ACYDCX_01715 [Acidithiobacillus sp.]
MGKRWDIWVYHHDLMPGLMAAKKSMGDSWEKMNIARNRRAINKVSASLDINPQWVQGDYSWLLNHNITR